MSSAAATVSTLPLPNSPARNPFEVARSHLIRRLLEMPVPGPAAIGEASDHIRDAANIFDEWLYAVGSQVSDRVMVDVDMRVFQGAFLCAVDGNATWEVDCAIEAAGRRRTLRRA